MKKIVGYLPIYATAKFYIDKPDNWDNIDREDQINIFLEYCKKHSETSLCHECSRNTETNFITADEFMPEDDDFDLWEE